MFGKVSTDKLTRAGFQLESCEDGRFWVYQREAGEDADRLLRICRKTLENFDEETVQDLILIQCDADFANPTLYLDDYIWELSSRDLSDIVSLLWKDRQKQVKKQHEAVNSENRENLSNRLRRLYKRSP